MSGQDALKAGPADVGAPAIQLHFAHTVQGGLFGGFLFFSVFFSLQDPPPPPLLFFVTCQLPFLNRLLTLIRG